MWTNEKDLPLLITNWLIQSNYTNEIPEQYQHLRKISATSLLKPTRAIILGNRIEGTGKQVIDISTLIASRMGQAIHESIEQSWRHGNLSLLSEAGVPKKIAENIHVDPIEPTKGVDVYFEQRAFKELDGWVISGQFDAVLNGQVIDFKSTGTYTFTAGNKDDDYSTQGSIYRWLNPELITKPTMAINFIFKDWSPLKAKITSDYPKAQIVSKIYPLMSTEETEQFILAKIRELDLYWEAEEKDLPICSDAELWRSDPVYKYYAKEDSVRATKVFEDLSAANMFLASKKNVGLIRTFPSKARACKYCTARPICGQYRDLLDKGEIDGESD